MGEYEYIGFSGSIVQITNQETDKENVISEGIILKYHSDTSKFEILTSLGKKIFTKVNPEYKINRVQLGEEIDSCLRDFYASFLKKENAQVFVEQEKKNQLLLQERLNGLNSIKSYDEFTNSLVNSLKEKELVFDNLIVKEKKSFSHISFRIEEHYNVVITFNDVYIKSIMIDSKEDINVNLSNLRNEIKEVNIDEGIVILKRQNFSNVSKLSQYYPIGLYSDKIKAFLDKNSANLVTHNVLTKLIEDNYELRQQHGVKFKNSKKHALTTETTEFISELLSIAFNG